MIKLYTTHCPKCIMLESKLKQKNIQYETITDFDIDNMMDRGYATMPLLDVDGEMMEFDQAIKWVNKRKK